LSADTLYQLSAKSTPPNVVDDVLAKAKSGPVSEAEVKTLLADNRTKRDRDTRKKHKENEKAEKARRREQALKLAEREAEEQEKDRQAAEAWVAKQRQQTEKAPDPLSVLQRAWDAAPDEVKRQFTIANAVQLRTILGLTTTPGMRLPVSEHAIADKVERAIARSSQTATSTPKPAPINLDIPGFLRRS
jgi:hypothetical protein